MKRQILVDMDGVLADVYPQFLQLEKEMNGRDIDPKTLYGIKEPDAFPGFWELVRTEGFFLDAPVMEGSVEGLQYLNGRYSLLIVSAAVEFGIAMVDKVRWMERHFPFISKKQIVFCGTKEHIVGDVMIDDHLGNLGKFKGEKYMFAQPHNVNIPENGFKKVHSWAELMDLL